MIIEAIRSEDESFALFWHLIIDTKSFAKSFSSGFFIFFYFLFFIFFLCRQDNSVAHDLARHTRYVSNFFVWR